MNFLRLALALLLSLAAAAQQIPKDLPNSGLEWAQAANPQQYFDATGRRSAVFGRQTGLFEAWIWPIKVLHGFLLEFQQQGMPEPVRGEAWLAQVITRPESTTLVYAHPLFTVREIIWAPRDEPALAIFFDVDSSKPLSITAKFVPDFKPMWPASLGGQHSYWLDDDKAFALTDGTGKPTALVGSPAVGAFTEFMDHSLIGGEMLLRLQVTPEQARAGLVPLVMSLSMENLKGAQTVYREVLSRLRPLYDTRVAYHKDFLARTLQIETPDPVLNRAFVWAKVAIDSGWVCHTTPAGMKSGDPAGQTEYCGLVAGYGPSGEGERPGFAWWFGGDGLIATWAMLDYGDTAGALQELRFLKARQRADGKMMHEMVQSVDLVDWFGKYGFAYMHADTTPMYLYTLGQYWRRTGDRKFLEEFWPSAKKAYEWCLTTVDPKDGLMDLTKAGLGAIEVGVLRGKVTKDTYTEGFWVGGLDAVADMASAMKGEQLSGDAKTRLATAMKSLDTHWWNPEGKYFAFGVTNAGERADMVGVWPSVLLTLGSSLDREKADAEVRTLALPELHSDWADRWISDKSPLFDPVSYNNGTVWPFMNTFVSWAEFRYGSAAAFSTLHDTAALTGIQSPGYMPEHMNGERFLPGERSVPHQLFSTVGVLLPMVRGLLGLDTTQLITYISRGPQPGLPLLFNVPASWDWLRFKGYRYGDGGLSCELKRQTGETKMTLEWNGSKYLPVMTTAGISFGKDLEFVQVTSHGDQISSRPRPGEFTTIFVLKGHDTITARYSGGISLVPSVASPQPGARSSALKVIGFTGDAHAAELTIAGLGGRTYGLDFVSTLPNLTTDAGTLAKTATGYRLTISFEGTDYVTRVVHLVY
jgi:hypothetical protein